MLAEAVLTMGCSGSLPVAEADLLGCHSGVWLKAQGLIRTLGLGKRSLKRFAGWTYCTHTQVLSLSLSISLFVCVSLSLSLCLSLYLSLLSSTVRRQFNPVLAKNARNDPSTTGLKSPNQERLHSETRTGWPVVGNPLLSLSLGK